MNIKSYVVTTTTESADHNVYFFKCKNDLSKEDVIKWLKENSLDEYDEEEDSLTEYINDILELKIEDFILIDNDNN